MNQVSIPRHGYHLVNASPWPLLTSVALFGLTIGGVLNFHFFSKGSLLLLLSFFFVIFCAVLWWRDVIREGTAEGFHSSYVQKGLRYGMLLFILSEVMFFLGFFWAFFHSSLAPSIEIGSIWPPVGISVFSPWRVPLLNTLVLLLSGASITWAHYALICKKKEEAIHSILVTICLALFFTGLQLAEYYEAPYRISDGVYGSTFYMATGFHGFHVIIGTIFIIVCFYRYIAGHFTPEHHFGFEAAAWYWHFVDVVWLFLYISIYYWGNKKVNLYI